MQPGNLPPTPENCPLPTGNCRSLPTDNCPLTTAFIPPAFPYAKTAILLPQTASPELRAAVGAALSHGRLRSTCTQSAEDAAVGPTDTTVVAAGWKDAANDIAAYFQEYYPHVSFSTIDGLTPTDIAIQLLPPLTDDIALSQRDPRWAGQRFGEDPTSTLGSHGCFVTACAMLLRATYGTDVLPCILDQLLVNARHAFIAGNLIHWYGFSSLFARFHNATFTNIRYPPAHLADLLTARYHIILRRSDGNHFVYLESVDGADLRIIDPLTGRRATWQASQYQGIRAARYVPPSLTPVPDPSPPPAPDPPPDPTPDPPPLPGGPSGPTVSFHAQAGAQGDMEYIARVKPAVFKLCHQAGMAGRIHELSPQTLIVYRKVWNDWHYWVYRPDLAKSVDDFISWLLPEIIEIHEAVEGAQIAIEGLNETIATGALEDIRRVVEFERIFAYKLAALPYNCVPVVLNTAVGNPQHGDETAMLIPAIRAVCEVGGFGAYHGYWPSNRHRTWLATDFEHYAGRFAESWDPVFRAAGLRPRYIITESGPISGPNPPYHLDALAGWRHHTCNNGDWPKTLAEILQFERLVRDTVPGREGRYYGQCLFTTGGVGWHDFQFRQAEFTAIADALLAEGHTVSNPDGSPPLSTTCPDPGSADPPQSIAPGSPPSGTPEECDGSS